MPDNEAAGPIEAGAEAADAGDFSARLAGELGAAVQAVREGDLARALAAAEGALTLAPENPDCHLVLATVHHNAGRGHEAESHYVQCLRLNPRSVRALTNLGLLKLNSGHGAEAVKALEAAVAMDARSAEARHYLARAYGMSGRLDAAIGQFEALLSHAAHDIQVLLGYAKALLAAGRGADAERILRRDESLSPGDPSVASALEAVRRHRSRQTAQ
jgi:Flp pilus assembly protein TadD